MSTTRVSSSLDIKAPPEVIFDILANPHRHSEIDGSGSVVGDVEGPDRLSQGAVFKVKMHIKISYTMTNTVVEFEENRLIAWRPKGNVRWRYELKPAGEVTTVTETWDISSLPAPMRVFFNLIGMPKRTKKSLDATLERLKTAAESAA